MNYTSGLTVVVHIVRLIFEQTNTDGIQGEETIPLSRLVRIKMDEQNRSGGMRMVSRLLPLFRNANPVFFCLTIHTLVRVFLSFSPEFRLNH